MIKFLEKIKEVNSMQNGLVSLFAVFAKLRIKASEQSKKFCSIFLILLWFPAYGQDDPSLVLRFETEAEYVDFYYALDPVLRQIYPKISVAWVKRNTSQYETDLHNIILLADRDFNGQKKASPVQVVADDLGPAIVPIISRGFPLLAKRIKTKENEASWVVVIGFLENGGKFIIDDSKIGNNRIEIPAKDINVAYYFTHLNKVSKKI
ncbi:hypothetical protein [Leptospira fainei]|nr:hypothetical protein [Leptospira fainei]